MTRRLILIRHAKAVREAPDGDHARPLETRGRNDAEAVGTWLQQIGVQIDAVLCSDARRTRETYQVIADAVGAPKVTDPMALYHASTEMLERAVITALSEGARSIVLVGHNPGVGGFAHSLAAAAISPTPASVLNVVPP